MVINYGELMPYLLRRPFVVLVLVALTLLPGATAVVVEPSLLAQGTYQERDFLNRIRRLTVEGRRAGEG